MLQMNEEWLIKKKEELLYLCNTLNFKDIEIEVILDKSGGCRIDENIWNNFNEYLTLKEKEKKDKITTSIADLLGTYLFTNGGHQIIFYKENIDCATNRLKENLSLLFRHLAVCQAPWYSDRNHFPLEYDWARMALAESENYEKFIETMSKYLIEELKFWGVIKEEDKDKKIEEKIGLLNICDREVFDGIYEIVFLHEAGHLIHHLMLNNYDAFINLDNSLKEALADLFSLYFSPSLKLKVKFLSLAQSSDQSWFKYYQGLYKDNFIVKAKNNTEFIEILEKAVK